MNRQLKRVATRFLLIAFGVVLAFATIEIVLDISSFISKLNHQYKYAQLSRKEDSVRILAIGESTTEGIGSKAPWPAQLEGILRKRFPDKSFQVINRGLAGVTSAYIANHLPEWMSQIEPHFVVSMIGTNDRGNVFVFPAQTWLPEWVGRLRTYRFLRGIVRSWIESAARNVQASLGQAAYAEDRPPSTKSSVCSQIETASESDFVKEYIAATKDGELFEMAQKCQAERRAIAANILFDAAINKNPNERYFAIAGKTANVTQGNYARSERILTDGLRTHPNSALLYAELAYMKLNPGEPQRFQKAPAEAAAAAVKAIELDPRNLGHYDLLLRVFREGRLEALPYEPIFVRVADYISDPSQVAVLRAKFYELSNLPEKRREQLELGLKADRPIEANYFELARLSLSQGRLPDQRANLEKGLELYPKSEGLLHYLGQSYFVNRDFDKAIEIYLKIVQLQESKMSGDTLWNVRVFLKQSDPLEKAMNLLINSAKQYKSSTPELLDDFLKSRKMTMSEDGFTRVNYNRILKTVQESGAILIAMQYPRQELQRLKDVFEPNSGVIFVDNKESFEDVLRTHPYEEVFVDGITPPNGVRFGHCTDLGNQILANAAAEAIAKLL